MQLEQQFLEYIGALLQEQRGRAKLKITFPAPVEVQIGRPRRRHG